MVPKKKKEPEPAEEDDDDEYFDEEAEKEKDRLRKLRNMNRRAHRGFSQAEILMMRWELVPKTMETDLSEDPADWDCKICKRPIAFTPAQPTQKYMQLKCGHRYHKHCLEVFFMRENICSHCEELQMLPDLI